MKTAIDIGLYGLLSGYALSMLSMFLIFYQKINLKKKLFISILRMSIQLIVIGYVLTYVFKIQNHFLVIAILFVMIFSSAHIIISNSELSLKRFFPSIVLIVILTVFSMVAFFILIILQQYEISKILNPQYIIPITGMLLGNTMNSGVLGLRVLKSSIEENEKLILQKLAMGASPKETLKNEIKKAFQLAILPNISSMAGTGLVALPGMMTGQILSGIEPLLAVKYQLAIMLVINGTRSLATFFIIRICYKKFFTDDWKLR